MQTVASEPALEPTQSHDPAPAAGPNGPAPTVASSEPDVPEVDWEERLGALVHENLVTFNPLPLASATLVLGGLLLLLLEPELVDGFGGLVISGLAELYAFALVGSAAILVRAGERRIAVMLGLLAVVFQCDVTLHVERAATMGALGVLWSVLWVALFHLKAGLLARALGLRLTRGARLVPTLGAAALATLGQVLPLLSRDACGALVALVVFGLGAVALHTERSVESEVGFDVRGRRSLRAMWAMLAVGLMLHLVSWATSAGVPPLRITPMLVLLALSRLRVTELRTFGIVASTLAVTAAVDPGGLALVALAASVTLVLRASRKASRAPATTTAADPPYRTGDASAAVEPPSERTVFTPAPAAERDRLLLGAAASLHLAAWSALSPGALPTTHVLWLDAILVAVAVATLVRTRRWTSLIPVLVVGGGALAEVGALRTPRSAGELGAWALVTGFLSLGAGVRVSLRSRFAMPNVS